MEKYYLIVGFPSLKDFYVEANVIDSSDKQIAKMYEGDSGALWVKELFLTGNAVLEWSAKKC